MPVWRVEHPETGIKFKVEGDRAPTEAELMEIFNAVKTNWGPAAKGDTETLSNAPEEPQTPDLEHQLATTPIPPVGLTLRRPDDPAFSEEYRKGTAYNIGKGVETGGENLGKSFSSLMSFMESGGVPGAAMRKVLGQKVGGTAGRIGGTVTTLPYQLVARMAKLFGGGEATSGDIGTPAKEYFKEKVEETRIERERAEPGSMAGMLAEGGVSAIPSVAAAPAGLTAAAIAAGLQVFGDRYADATDAYMKQNPKLSRQDAADKATPVAVLDGLQTALLTRLIPGGESAIANAFKRGGASAAKQAGRDIVGKYITSQAAKGGLKIAKEGALEGVEEGLNQAVSGAIDRWTYEPDKTWEQVYEEAKLGGSLGIVLGTGMGAGGLAVESMMAKQPKVEEPDETEKTIAKESEARAEEAFAPTKAQEQADLKSLQEAMTKNQIVPRGAPSPEIKQEIPKPKPEPEPAKAPVPTAPIPEPKPAPQPPAAPEPKPSDLMTPEFQKFSKEATEQQGPSAIVQKLDESLQKIDELLGRKQEQETQAAIQKELETKPKVEEPADSTEFDQLQKRLNEKKEPDAIDRQLDESLKKIDELLGRKEKLGEQEKIKAELERKAKEEPASAPEPGSVAAFTTSSGSTYQVHEDGTTTRNKAARELHPGDSGPKQRSAKTVYVSPNMAREIGMWQTSSATKKRLRLNNGKVQLLSWNENAGRMGLDRTDESTDSTFSDIPQAGKHPLELWEPDRNGLYRGNHPGSKITDIALQQSPTQKATAPAEAVAREPLTGIEALNQAAEKPAEQPAAQPTEKPLDVQRGDVVRWEPNERERRYQEPVEGTVVDVISNPEGEVGYHILSPREGDPGNVVRVWGNRGKIVSRERPSLDEEPKTVRETEAQRRKDRIEPRRKSIVEIADEIAAQGVDPQASYGLFVKARALKPEIDAAEWLPIYRKSLELARLKPPVVKESFTTEKTPTVKESLPAEKPPELLPDDTALMDFEKAASVYGELESETAEAISNPAEVQRRYRATLENAVSKKQPVNAYGWTTDLRNKVSEGYVREGDLYVYRPAEKPVEKKADQPETGRAKEPWEMTKKEWRANSDYRKRITGVGNEYQGYGGKRARAFDDAIDTAHYMQVSKAIDEGKPVPPEVLADYPDLKPSAPEAPKAEAPKDKIESTLERVIEATERKPGQLMEGITSMPIWITQDAANLAAKAFLATYRAGKPIVYAIAEALKPLRSLEGYNDAEARKWLVDNSFGWLDAAGLSTELPEQPERKPATPQEREQARKLAEEPPFVNVDKEELNVETVKRKLNDLGLYRHTSGQFMSTRQGFGPVVKHAYETMALGEMKMREGIQRDIESIVEHPLSLLPREYRRNDNKLFFDLLWGNRTIKDIEAMNIPDSVKEAARNIKWRLENMRLEMREFKRERYEGYLNGMDKPFLEGLYKEEFGTEADGTKAEIAKELSDKMYPYDWGIADGTYMPHLFLGKWEVRQMGVPGTKKGYMSLGRYATEAEALTELKKMVKADPSLAGGEFQITAERMMPGDMLRIGDGKFWRLIKEFKDEYNVSGSEARDMVSGIIGRKASKEKWFGSTKHRYGSEHYNKNFRKQMSAYIYGFHRWKNLTEMNREIQPAIEQMRADGQTSMAKWYETTLNQLWGERFDSSLSVDEFFENTKLGRIFKTEPMVLDRAMAQVKRIAAVAQLFTIKQAVVNRLQPFQGVYALTGPEIAAKAETLRLSKQGRELLDDAGVSFDIGQYGALGFQGRFDRFREKLLGERENHERAFLSMYLYAKEKLGMTEAEAIKHGKLQGQLKTQFMPLLVDTPMFMRGPITSTMFQYKRFPLKQLELTADMIRDKNVPALVRMFGFYMLAGGLSFYMRNLPIGDDDQEALRRKLEKEIGKNDTDILFGMLPGMAGADISGSLALLDMPPGQNVWEKMARYFSGPALSLTADQISMATKDRTEPISKSQRLREQMRRVPALRPLAELWSITDMDPTLRTVDGKEKFDRTLGDILVNMGSFRSQRESRWANQIGAVKAAQEHLDDLKNEYYLARVEGRDVEPILRKIDQSNSLYPELYIGGAELRNYVRDKRKRSGKSVSERMGFDEDFPLGGEE